MSDLLKRMVDMLKELEWSGETTLGSADGRETDREHDCCPMCCGLKELPTHVWVPRYDDPDEYAKVLPHPMHNKDVGHTPMCELKELLDAGGKADA